MSSEWYNFKNKNICFKIKKKQDYNKNPRGNWENPSKNDLNSCILGILNFIASNKDNTFEMQDSSRDQQWQCARCTLLVEIKLLVCPMCGKCKSRAACPTPDFDMAEEKETPEIPKKKCKYVRNLSESCGQTRRKRKVPARESTVSTTWTRAHASGSIGTWLSKKKKTVNEEAWRI